MSFAPATGPQNARTVGSLMYAINHFRRPRSESVLTDAELAAIAAPTMFVRGSDAPYLSAGRAQPSIDRMRAANPPRSARRPRSLAR